MRNELVLRHTKIAKWYIVDWRHWRVEFEQLLDTLQHLFLYRYGGRKRWIGWHVLVRKFILHRGVRISIVNVCATSSSISASSFSCRCDKRIRDVQTMVDLVNESTFHSRSCSVEFPFTFQFEIMLWQIDSGTPSIKCSPVRIPHIFCCIEAPCCTTLRSIQQRIYLTVALTASHQLLFRVIKSSVTYGSG